MARRGLQYVCRACGSVHARWQGRCQDCGVYNTVEECDGGYVSQARQGGGRGGKKRAAIEMQDLRGDDESSCRYAGGIEELDRVLGGGLVPGSVVLLGGDPGIGKSTLLLQALARFAENYRCAYFSAEESVAQIRLRARRLELTEAAVNLAATSEVEAICDFMTATPTDIVVVDSIQTVYLSQLDSAPGSVAQVRTAAHELIQTAKARNVALFLVGHVTKDGAIAGPRLLEHMVDVVLYFEGERGHRFRILRGIKNRYADTDEIGVFDMSATGLAEVSNPSALFLGDRREAIAGTVIFAAMEGRRPILVEVQALVTASYLTMPRRQGVGCDTARLSMLLAVLERYSGIRFGTYDVYVNIAGGLKVVEPAADLAIITALLSAVFQVATDADRVVFGELGLSGEVRRVPRADMRLREAQKLGFKRALMPPADSDNGSVGADIALDIVRSVQDILRYFPKHKRQDSRPARPTSVASEP